MNHGSAHRVTQTYVKKDFSSAWDLNEKVVELIFFSDNPGKEELRREEKKLETDRISKNHLLRGTAFYKGKVVAEEEKTGFTNKGQLVALLINLTGWILRLTGQAHIDPFLRICLRQSLILRDVALDGLPADTYSAGYLPLTQTINAMVMENLFFLVHVYHVLTNYTITAPF